jgi:hypothetical protein
MTDKSAQLVSRGVKLLRRYLETHRTDYLKALAEVVVHLRGSHTLSDGRTVDWSGRSPAYRQSMADLYTRAKVPEDRLDTIQTALRYHVGNLVREQAQADELQAVGLSPVAPKTRLATQRKVAQAQQRTSIPRQDVASLAIYAQAFVEYIDERVILVMPEERRHAARAALTAVQTRAEALLRCIAEADERPGRPSEAALPV